MIVPALVERRELHHFATSNTGGAFFHTQTLSNVGADAGLSHSTYTPLVSRYLSVVTDKLTLDNTTSAPQYQALAERQQGEPGTQQES